MIDIGQYRLAESLARVQAPHWRAFGEHSLVVFERIGFPVRLNTVRELETILDTMQENRFHAYMIERNGFTGAEFEQLVDALTAFVKFSRRQFDRNRSIIPLSTMAAHLAIYSKIAALRPQFENILEIGPGCGYLSFFLKNHHDLKYYAQIEACESFYILQSMVNDDLFGDQFTDHAELDRSNSYARYQWVNQSQNVILGEPLKYFQWSPPKSTPRVEHFPSWKIGELYDSPESFDVITSNANLNEFSEGAMHQYFALVRKKLRPDGVFFVQCFGGGEVSRNVISSLFTFEFAPLFVGVGPLQLGESLSANFLTWNGIFVQKRHPIWAQAYQPQDFKVPLVVPGAMVIQAMFPPLEGRRIYSQQETLEALAARVGGDPTLIET